MKRRRYLLPQDLAVAEPLHYTFRRGWPWLLALLLPPLAAYVWRGRHLGEWGWSLIGILVAFAAALKIWHGLLTRSTEGRRRIHDRHSHPVRYWMTIVTLTALYLFSLVALICAPVARLNIKSAPPGGTATPGR